jgi:hypothetical protein
MGVPFGSRAERTTEPGLTPNPVLDVQSPLAGQEVARPVEIRSICDSEKVSEHPEAHHLRETLHHLEQRLVPLVSRVEDACGELADGVGRGTARMVPAWQRATEGELRWPVGMVVSGVITLQLLLPSRLTFTGRWLLPVIEVGLGTVLAISDPRRFTRRSPILRLLGMLLIGTASLANGWSAALLVHGIVEGHEGKDATALLVTAGNIWITNVIIFALWYWELDRGGPAARAMGLNPRPDFLFPEMTAPELAGEQWKPLFIDYLYVAFTNATAFSPTDTMPFSRWSKLAMMLQSTISMATGVLVIARAVNILP